MIMGSLHLVVHVVLRSKELVFLPLVPLLVELALLGVVQPGHFGLLALDGLLVGLVVEQSLVVPLHVDGQFMHE